MYRLRNWKLGGARWERGASTGKWLFGNGEGQWMYEKREGVFQESATLLHSNSVL